MAHFDERTEDIQLPVRPAMSNDCIFFKTSGGLLGWFCPSSLSAWQFDQREGLETLTGDRPIGWIRLGFCLTGGDLLCSTVSRDHLPDRTSLGTHIHSSR